jgi:integrase
LDNIDIKILRYPKLAKCASCSRVRDIYYKALIYDVDDKKSIVRDLDLCKLCGENLHKEVPDEEPLFRVAKRTLQGHAERIKKNTGINFYSHRARHTFATNLLAKDTRLDVIQRVMGHADISTTRKYAETLNQDILSIA